MLHKTHKIALTVMMLVSTTTTLPMGGCLTRLRARWNGQAVAAQLPKAVFATARDKSAIQIQDTFGSKVSFKVTPATTVGDFKKQINEFIDQNSTAIKLQVSGLTLQDAQIMSDAGQSIVLIGGAFNQRSIAKAQQAQEKREAAMPTSDDSKVGIEMPNIGLAATQHPTTTSPKVSMLSGGPAAITDSITVDINTSTSSAAPQTVAQEDDIYAGQMPVPTGPRPPTRYEILMTLLEGKRGKRLIQALVVSSALATQVSDISFINNLATGSDLVNNRFYVGDSAAALTLFLTGSVATLYRRLCYDRLPPSSLKSVFCQKHPEFIAGGIALLFGLVCSTSQVLTAINKNIPYVPDAVFYSSSIISTSLNAWFLSQLTYEQRESIQQAVKKMVARCSGRAQPNATSGSSVNNTAAAATAGPAVINDTKVAEKASTSSATTVNTDATTSTVIV